jgi:hypothetical protein
MMLQIQQLLHTGLNNYYMKRYIGFLLLIFSISISAQIYNKQFIANYSSELTLNCSTNNAFEILLGSNVTISLSNTNGAKGIRLWLVQDGTGNRVVHYSSQFTFSPLFKDTTVRTANTTTVVEFTINERKIYCTYNSNIAGSSSGGISTVNTTLPIMGDGSSGSHVRADTTKAPGRLATYNDVLGKVDKVIGKGLSTNDLTSVLKTKYDSVSLKQNKTDTASNSVNGVMTKYDHAMLFYNTPAKNLTFSGPIDLTNHKSSNYNDYTITGALSVTIIANPVDGSIAGILLTADGTNIPTFTGLYLTSGTWANTTGTKNLLTFWQLGGHTYFSISQPSIQ